MDLNLKTIAVFSCLFVLASAADTEYGNLIGRFEDGPTSYGVVGEVYAVDNRTFLVRGFSYTGDAPDAFFYVGSHSAEPSVGGMIIPLPGEGGKLKKYEDEDVTFTLPSGTITDYNWLSVWCRSVGVNFGDVKISPSLVLPAPVSLGSFGFAPRVHNVHAREVIVRNDRQFQFIDLYYDGTGRAAYFWIGDGSPDQDDIRVPHPPNEPDVKLPRYSGDTVMVTLPEGFTANNIDFIGIWCEVDAQDYGHIPLDSFNLDNLPPYI